MVISWNANNNFMTQKKHYKKMHDQISTNTNNLFLSFCCTLSLIFYHFFLSFLYHKQFVSYFLFHLTNSNFFFMLLKSIYFVCKTRSAQKNMPFVSKTTKITIMKHCFYDIIYRTTIWNWLVYRNNYVSFRNNYK